MTESNRIRCISLIGMPGSGKSTCGRLLAQTLGFVFLDSDRLIEESEKRTISQIFEFDGESRFRQLEQELLEILEDRLHSQFSSATKSLWKKSGLAFHLEKQLTASTPGTTLPGLVLACGGGMPVPPVNQSLLSRLGTVVYLHADPSEIEKRIQSDKGRPLLVASTCLNDSLHLLLDSRRHSYEQAHVTIDTTGLGTVAIVKQLQISLQDLKEHH